MTDIKSAGSLLEYQIWIRVDLIDSETGAGTAQVQGVGKAQHAFD
jgi:hypothetical protein